MRFNAKFIVTSSALALTVGLASPAFAQEATTTPPPCAADQTENCTPVEVAKPAQPAAQNSQEDEIVVVGSRLRRDEFNTADSVQVLTRKETTQAGFVSTAEVLQSTAVTGGTSQINDSYGGFVVDGGPGVNTISLRGLGATRTLVLLNGRRVSPAGSRGAVGAADLNTLPAIITDRIEILNTGASSVYGSDAVAGVVNIVTRSKFKGFQVEAQALAPEVGNGSAYRIGAIAGFQKGGLDVLASFEYYQRDSLVMGDRKFTSCPTGYYGTNGNDFGAGDFIDPRTGAVQCFPLENGGVTVNTIAIGGQVFEQGSIPDGALAPGVVSLAPANTEFYLCNRYRPVTAGSGDPGVPGYECVGGSYYDADANLISGMSLNIRDTRSRDALREDLISGAKTYTGYLQATYDTNVLGNAQIYASFLGSRRSSEQNGTRQLTIDYVPNSPLIPAELIAAGRVNSSIGVRAFTDYGLYNNRQTVDFYRLNGGVKGKMPYDWRYDLFFGYSSSKSKYTTDLVLSDRINNSLRVVSDGNGGFVCANAAYRAAGCVAAPALTPAVVAGDYQNTDWFRYITEPVTGITKYKEKTVNLTVDGPLFRLPAGKVQAALGVEYRKASIDDTPDIESQNGNLYGFTSSTITRGSDSVWEAFGEVEVPILREQLFHSLSLNASGRYTHYKSYGGGWTYKVGGSFAPIKAVSFRGSYGTSYRAPALYEQFLGASSGFLNQQTDPCYQLASVTNPLVRERCLAEGLPADFQQNNSVTVIGLGGAEAGLKSETSKALTYGVVITPPLGSFADVSLSADYFNVKVANGISRLSAGQVLSQCYNDPQRTLCDTPFIRRTPYTGPGTGALTVVTSYINISDAKVSGIDFNARMAKQIGPGKLTFDAAMTKFIKRYDRTLPTDDIVNDIGMLENPKWTGTFDVNYGLKSWGFHYGVEWVGKTSSQSYAEQFGYDRDTYKLSTPDYFLHNASISYDTKEFGLTLGVRNLFDTSPPRITADWTTLVGNAPLYSGYDYRGRTFFLNVRAGLGVK